MNLIHLNLIHLNLIHWNLVYLNLVYLNLIHLNLIHFTFNWKRRITPIVPSPKYPPRKLSSSLSCGQFIYNTDSMTHSCHSSHSTDDRLTSERRAHRNAIIEMQSPRLSVRLYTWPFRTLVKIYGFYKTLIVP